VMSKSPPVDGVVALDMIQFYPAQLIYDHLQTILQLLPAANAALVGAPDFGRAA